MRAALAAAVVCAACSSDADEAERQPGTAVQLGGPGETNRVLSADELADVPASAYTDADVAFVRDMIHHHRQALEMTALVPARTKRNDLPLLAERMDISQLDEIERLERWLVARGESPPTANDHGDAAHSMPGMLSDAELAELDAAGGAEFDRLFLRYMIRHHEGAMSMVETLLSGEGGQESEMFALAGHISSDQAVEIARMKRLLNGL